MEKTKSSKKNLSFSLQNTTTNLSRNQFKFPETKSSTTLMFNPKNILSIKKSTSMKPMFKKKNSNQFSKELMKKLKSSKNLSMFPDQLFINNLLFNLLLINRKSNWKLLMDLRDPLREHLESSPLNSTKL